MCSTIIKSNLSVSDSPLPTPKKESRLKHLDFLSGANIWEDRIIPQIMAKFMEVVSTNLLQLPRELQSIVAEYIYNARDIDLWDLGYRKSLAPFLNKIESVHLQFNTQYRFVFGEDDTICFYRGWRNSSVQMLGGYDLKPVGDIPCLASIRRMEVTENGCKERCKHNNGIKSGIHREINHLMLGCNGEFYSMVAAFPEGTLIKMEKEDSNTQDSWELVASAEWHLNRDLEVTTPNDGESTPTLQVSGKRKRDPETSTQSASTVTSSSASTTQAASGTKRPK